MNTSTFVTEPPQQDSTTDKPKNALATLLDTKSADSLAHPDAFVRRHVGPSALETKAMLDTLGFSSIDALIDEAIPVQIRLSKPLELPAGRTEYETLTALRALAAQNQVFRPYIGMGYYDCITPAVIQRNLFENPGWYTQYTPYQAEIAQGRLEALLNFQTMVIELTGLPIAVAAILPFGEIAWADGVAVEFGLQHGTNFRDSIESGENGFGFVAVLEALIELLADGVGESGDFAGARGS